MTREHIADLLRGNSRVSCLSKGIYEVQLRTPVLIHLEKDHLRIGGRRTINFKDAPSYIKGLTGMNTQAKRFDRNELRRATTSLSKLYGSRLIKGSKKDTSFQLDNPDNPTTVRLNASGCVRIEWAEGNDNVYEYDDCVQHLTEYGPEFTANTELTGQATQAEIDDAEDIPADEPDPDEDPRDSGKKKKKKKKNKNKKLDRKLNRKLKTKKDLKKSPPGPQEPQPPVVDPDEVPRPTARKRNKNKGVIHERKKKGTRVSKLGVGGVTLEGKTLKKAQSAVEGMRQGTAIRTLITDYDADNDSITEILGIDDKAVQRTRRAILREQRKKD